MFVRSNLGAVPNLRQLLQAAGVVDSMGNVLSAAGVYSTAANYGATGTDIENALGLAAGTANAWAQANGLPALSGQAVIGAPTVEVVAQPMPMTPDPNSSSVIYSPQTPGYIHYAGEPGPAQPAVMLPGASWTQYTLDPITGEQLYPGMVGLTKNVQTYFSNAQIDGPNPRDADRFYYAAKQYGIDGATIDKILGLPRGTAQYWINWYGPKAAVIDGGGVPYQAPIATTQATTPAAAVGVPSVTPTATNLSPFPPVQASPTYTTPPATSPAATTTGSPNVPNSGAQSPSVLDQADISNSPVFNASGNQQNASPITGNKWLLALAAAVAALALSK